MNENGNQEIKKRRTWLWVIGWIFAFPIPLTVLMLKSPRTAKLSIVLRVLIVIAGWILFFFLVSGSLFSAQKEEVRSNETQASAVAEKADRGNFAICDEFVQAFNETSGMTIQDAKDVENVSKRNSGYYRTEYRLAAFADAVAIVGRVEGFGQIEIVSYRHKDLAKKKRDLRVYADVKDKNQAATMFRAVANVLIKKEENKTYIDRCVTDILEESYRVSFLDLGDEAVGYYLYDEVFLDKNNGWDFD